MHTKKPSFLTTLLLFVFSQISAISSLHAETSNAPSNTTNIIVDTQWLNQHSNDTDLIIIDARTKNDYDKGHIPGAINLPVKKTFNQTEATDEVGNLFYIQKLFSNLGIKNNHKIAVYDDGIHIDAGRVFWVFELYSHDHVYLLNGGFPAWQMQTNLAISTTENHRPKTQYIPEVEPDILLTKLDMHQAITDENVVIIDARVTEEYEGKSSIAKQAGHIPSAINIPWKRAFIEVDGITMLRPNAELKQLYGRAAQVNKNVYTYCNQGKHASLTYTLLRQLGYDAAHYDGSWFEWGNDERLPLETSNHSATIK